MKKSILKLSLLVVLFAAFSSCTKSDTFDSVSQEVQTYSFTPTKTVAQVIAAGISATPTVYTGDDIIEAYVTSTDAAGTFYKSISLQDVQTADGTPIGFSVSADQTMLFQRGFFTGRKIYIKLKGLAIAKVNGSMQIGLVDPADSTQLTGISGTVLANYLFPSATIVDESKLLRHMSLSAAASDAVQNTLITIDNVQFADNSIARTYFDVDSGGYATNHDIVDATLGGTRYFCRISQYAPFSVNNVPTGRGSITGVMTKYSYDYQFIVRSEADFHLTNPRTYNFPATVNENFSSYPATSNYIYKTSFSNPLASSLSFVSFPKYINFANVGTTKKWFVKSGGYLEMSSFGGEVEQNRTYFIVPVDMTAASTFKFDIKAGFYTNGLGLKIYRTVDYVLGMKISDATLYDITGNFSLPTGSTTTFSSSGVYNIPATVTGNGYFVFEYTGTNISTAPPVTTTVDIDNIVIN
ncbi:DUF5689 domain-containing protein [Flavobacterium sp. N1994]|uniref:DUF5689 domain-containing protein n=1 Tax=Flavobacterium sp. N1994 TaxID=2986827 RepID=UPI00222244CC|nr:DUF5689 domain-containing protein [Flavobacterium sp. N1994]